jgi:predicted nucleic acid-binding protein
MRAIIDSDVMIDYLQGVEAAKNELAKYSHREASIVSWMEVMSGADNKQEAKACSDFLKTFTFHEVNMEIAAEAVELRKAFKLRLPDAIIWATARVNGYIIVTRNSKDFPVSEPGVRIPYNV